MCLSYRPSNPEFRIAPGWSRNIFSCFRVTQSHGLPDRLNSESVPVFTDHPGIRFPVWWMGFQDDFSREISVSPSCEGSEERAGSPPDSSGKSRKRNFITIKQVREKEPYSVRQLKIHLYSCCQNVISGNPYFKKNFQLGQNTNNITIKIFYSIIYWILTITICKSDKTYGSKLVKMLYKYHKW